MKLIITGFLGRDKKRVRQLIEDHTDLRVTSKYPWIQEFIASSKECAVLHPRTVLSYAKISVEQGLREVELIKEHKILVIFVDHYRNSSESIVLREQARLNKDIITLRVDHRSFARDMYMLKQRLKHLFGNRWKDDVQEQ